MFDQAAALPSPVLVNRRSGWLGFAAFAVFVLAAAAGRISDPGVAAGGALIALAPSVPLFLRRPRFPLAYAVVSTAGVVVLCNGNPGTVSWFAIAVLGAWCVLVGGVRVGLSYWVGSMLLLGGEWLFSAPKQGWGPWLAGVSLTVFATVLVRHELLLIDRLRRAQADLAERSRAEERNRIARELHDVIAHSLTVSLLHVSSARLAVEHDPADAARSLAEAERLGRQSLAEVRATMGPLRQAAGEAIAAPVPGAGDLPELIQQLRNAGADVSLTVDGNLAPLPATTGSTVYRIVQEALTNATKHAPASRVLVGVTVGGKDVTVRVESSGPPGQGSGMGLLSMRERAQAVGGTCTAGPGASGWLVQACMPLEIGLGLGDW